MHLNTVNYSIDILVINFRCSTLSDLQAEAALALTNCQKIATRKLEAEKLRRELEDAQALRTLIGRDIGRRLTKDSLEELNCPTIQVRLYDKNLKISFRYQNLFGEMLR